MLDSKHLQELKSSLISDSLIELNYRSVEGDIVYELLAYGLPNSERRNDGRLRDKWLRLYEHAAMDGGWWISGLDPLQDWQEEMEWGRFKPNSPRRSWDGENRVYTDRAIKYESPAKAKNHLTYHRVPLDIWNLTAKKLGITMPIPGEINFWQWVQQNPDIPIVLTEGEKKAGCMLCQGFPAIALPGIWMGTVKTQIKGIHQLHPDLVPLAQKGRKFIILFDYETKPKTQKNIRSAIGRLGKALEEQNCKVEIAILPGPEKGIDDWALALGGKAQSAIESLISDAVSLSDYTGKNWENKGRNLRKFRPDLVVDTAYLSDKVALPNSGLVGLQSDMGTGKTYLLELWRKSNPWARFLNNGHRVNLLRNLAKRLNTEMYSQVPTSQLSSISELSITADSLYKLAHNLEQYGCVFIDEACQYVVHLLQSKTLKHHRAEILETLECIIYNAKLVILADAHLDDTTIAFFQAMRPPEEKPFIIQNLHRSGGRKVFWYETKTNSSIVAQIHASLLEGKKAMIVSSSKRFIKKLELTLLDLPSPQSIKIEESYQNVDQGLPGLKIWTIHSENSGSPENVAFIEDINQSVKGVDALLASPSLGTGVDINEFHFDVIFGVFEAGKLAATDCAQQLWRYRPNVPMHVWVAPRPSFGYKESNARKIKKRILDGNEMGAFLIRLDRETGKRGAEKDWALDAYCQIEAKRNFSINNLRQDLRSLLEEMGNQISPVDTEEDKEMKTQIKKAGEKIDLLYYDKVANAQEIDKDLFEQRKRKDYLSPEEFFEVEKYRLRDSYGMEVTKELAEIDNKQKIISRIANLEAILETSEEILAGTQESIPSAPELVQERDLIDRDLHPICTDWANHSVSWLLRHKLNLEEIIAYLLEGGELSNSHPLVVELREKAIRYSSLIKEFLNLTIPKGQSPMWILTILLQQLGIKLVSHRPGSGEKRARIYTLDSHRWEFIEAVLSHRRRKREQRQNRRDEIQQRNLAHQSRMHRVYGFDLSSVPPPKSRLQTLRERLDYSHKNSVLSKNKHREMQERGSTKLC